MQDKNFSFFKANPPQRASAAVRMRLASLHSAAASLFLGSRDHLKRNSFSWVFGVIIPLYFFGTADNLKLLGWKVCVTCAGCIVFHVVRKQMFPYIDPGYLVDKISEEGENPDDQFMRVFALIAECLLLGLLGHAIIGAVAGGL